MRQEFMQREKPIAEIGFGARTEQEQAPGQVSLKTDLIGPSWTGREGGESLDVVPVAMRLVISSVNSVLPENVQLISLSRLSTSLT